VRAFGTSYGVDISGFTDARFDAVKLPFTEEGFAKLLREAGLFALVPAADGKVELRSTDGSEVLDAAVVEANVLTIVAAREDALKAAEKAAFDERLTESVAFIPDVAAVPTGSSSWGRSSASPMWPLLRSLSSPFPHRKQVHCIRNLARHFEMCGLR
jgi:hypothetical protein